jgi:uncharacterized membrane protein
VKAISPSDAWAVGSADSGVADQTTLTLHWDGRRWTIVPSPRPGTLGLNVLYGVAANSGNDVWAVGSYTNTGEFAQTLTVHWDGVSWSVVPSPSGSNDIVYGVSSASANDIWAVGRSQNTFTFQTSTLVVHGDGNS